MQHVYQLTEPIRTHNVNMPFLKGCGGMTFYPKYRKCIMHRSAIKAPCVGLQQSLPVGPTYSPVGHSAFHLVDIEINSHSTQMDHKMRKKRGWEEHRADHVCDKGLFTVVGREKGLGNHGKDHTGRSKVFI